MLSRHAEARIIPACAGKSPRRLDFVIQPEDHPRLRGEKMASSMWSACVCGSSPLARGKGVDGLRESRFFRIIPACAGKSGLRKPRHKRNRDHPRLRGEKGDNMDQRSFTEGSSPLARGKGYQRAPLLSWLGIIPACAGKSSLSCVTVNFVRDHPRLRGEKAIFAAALGRMTGSSPLARGKAAGVDPETGEIRIIPACAGKSFDVLCFSWPVWDHPRLRGEKLRLR